MRRNPGKNAEEKSRDAKLNKEVRFPGFVLSEHQVLIVLFHFLKWQQLQQVMKKREGSGKSKAAKTPASGGNGPFDMGSERAAKRSKILSGFRNK